MNIFKRAFDFLIVLTCILGSFTLYGCAAQRSVPQEPLLATSEEIDGEDVQSEEHLREFNSWDLKHPDKSEKIKETIKRIQENPDSSLIDRALARAYTLQMEGKITDATEKWHAIANITAENDNVFAAQALLSVGYLLQENNKDNEALPIYDKAIHLVSNYSRAFYHRGMLKDALDEHEAAVSDYQTAIAGYDESLGLDPSNVSAYLYRGRVKMRLEQYESALADFNEAIRLDSNNIEFYFDRGYAQVSLGQYESALADYDKVIELEPDNAYAYSNRGSAKLNLGQNASAILDYSASIRLKLDDAYVYSNRAKAKLNLGQNASAIADFDEVLRLNPDDGYAYNNRGYAKLNLSRYESAITDFDEAIRRTPDNSYAYSNRAKAKLNLGQNASAILDCNEAIRLKSDYANPFYNRGNAKLNLGQYESAITDLDEAIRLNPDFAGAYKSRGKVKSKLEKYEAAIADFDEAIRFSEAAIQELDLGNQNFFVAYDAYMNRADAKESLGFVEEAESDRQIARALPSPSLINKLDADVAKEGLGLGSVDFDPEHGVIEPKVKYLAEKKYPDIAKKVKKEGTVILKATIDENGIPRDIVALTSLGFGLEQAAIEMLKKSAFRPAMKGGKPISLEVEIPVDFRLKDN